MWRANRATREGLIQPSLATDATARFFAHAHGLLIVVFFFQFQENSALHGWFGYVPADTEDNLYFLLITEDLLRSGARK